MKHCGLVFCAAAALLAANSEAAFSPADISGLELWLKADGICDANGNTPANNARVAQWRDSSGNNRHLTQGTDNNRPSYVASAINGLPAVAGSTASPQRWMTFPPNAPVSLRTMFMVAKHSTANHASMIFGKTGVDIFINGSSREVSLDVGDTTTQTNGRYSMNGGALSGYARNHTAPSIPSPLLFYMDYQNTAHAFTHFMRRTGGDYYYTGEIAEVVAFNRLLSTAEMNQVGRYLQDKFAIAGNYPPLADAFAVTGAADQIGDTHARLSATVVELTGTPVELRVYYGKTDGADVASNWWTNEVVDAAAETGALFAHDDRAA